MISLFIIIQYLSFLWKYIDIFAPAAAHWSLTPQWGSVWWVRLRKLHNNNNSNLLTLVIWKCVYDRIVYIVKKGINIFSKKGFLRGGHNPPPHKWSHTPLSLYNRLPKIKLLKITNSFWKLLVGLWPLINFNRNVLYLFS